MRRLAALAGVLATALLPAAPAAAAAACPPSPFTQELADDLARRFPGARFSASVLDLRDGCSYELDPWRRMTTASVFKVEVLAGVLLRAQQAGRGLTPWEAERVRPMIAESANPPTNDLFTSLGGVAGANRLHATFGLGETSTPSGTWGLTSTTARDQVHLLRQVLVGGGPLDAASRARAADELASVVPSQRWGITEGAPAGWPVLQKNGFAGSACCGWRLSSVGKVGDAYLVATLTDGWRSEAAGVLGNRHLNRAITTRLARVPTSGFPSAEAFVARQYRDLFGRAPDLDGLAAHTAAVHQGVDPAALVVWLLASPEHAPRDLVARLYLAGLGRDPDLGGWDHWTHLLVHGIASAGEVAHAVATSPEGGSRTTGDALLRRVREPGYVASTRARVDALVVTRALLRRGLRPGEEPADVDRAELVRRVLTSSEYAARTPRAG